MEVRGEEKSFALEVSALLLLYAAYNQFSGEHVCFGRGGGGE